MRWLAGAGIIRRITAADPVAGAAFASSTTFALDGPAAAPSLPATPVAVYHSLAQLIIDMRAVAIDPAYRWLLYDPEHWDLTPASEQADPWTSMQHFGQYAHAHGYRVIMTPARDLGNVATSVQPKQPGEDITAWYLRTGIAGVAAQHGDIVEVQSQALTLDVPAYSAFTSSASAQARAANPWAGHLAGISTHYGTAAQMAAAAQSVTPGGYWLNVPGPNSDIAEACAFLRLMLS